MGQIANAILDGQVLTVPYLIFYQRNLIMVIIQPILTPGGHLSLKTILEYITCG